MANIFISIPDNYPLNFDGLHLPILSIEQRIVSFVVVPTPVALYTTLTTIIDTSFCILTKLLKTTSFSLFSLLRLLNSLAVLDTIMQHTCVKVNRTVSLLILVEKSCPDFFATYANVIWTKTLTQACLCICR